MGSKGQSNTNQVQSYTPAPQAVAATQGALTQAQNAAQLPFSIPQAPVAGFSQDQQTAFQNVNNAQGMAIPYINQAGNYFQAGTQPNVNQFFNPLAGAVGAQLSNIFGQQNVQNTGSLVQAAGGTGADRVAVGQGNLANQQGLAAGQTFASLFQPALSAAQQQESLLQSAGYGYGALGSEAQNSVLQGAQAQLGTGGLQQQLAQAQLNAPYQQQVAQAMFPYQQSNFLTNAVASLAPGFGGTTSGYGNYTPAPPSLFSQIAGAGAAGAGIYGGLGGFGGTSTPSLSAGSIFGTGNGQISVGGPAGPTPFGGTNPYNVTGSLYERGGAINPFFDAGGSPFGSTPDTPINIDTQPIVPQGQTAKIAPHIPQVNLNPPQQSQSGPSASDFANIAKTALQIGTMFAARGGAISSDQMKKFDGYDPYSFFDSRFPKGYADGGSDDSGDTDAANAISGIESAGSKNPYSLLGPRTRSGDRAYGKYQVMGSNIPQWTQEATGQAATPQQFLADPGLQDRVFQHKFGEYSQKYGPEGAARAWFAGEGGMNDPNRKDVLGTSVADYAKKFNKLYGNSAKRGLPSVITGDQGGMPGNALGYADDNSSSPFSSPSSVADGLHQLRTGLQSITPNVFDSNRPKTPFGVMPPEASTGLLSVAGPAMMGATQGDVLTGHVPRMYASNLPASPTPPISHEDLPPAGPTPPGAEPTSPASSPSPLVPDVTTAAEWMGAPVSSPSPWPSARPDEALPPNATPTSGQGSPFASERQRTMADNPWLPLIAAGFGMMGGTSPYAGVNIGQGGMQGVKALMEQKQEAQKDETIDQAAKRLEMEQKFHEDQFTRSTPYQQFEMKKPQQIGKDIWGKPVMGVLDQKSGNWVDPATGKPIDPSKMGQMSDEAIESGAQAIAHYQQPPVSPYKATTEVGSKMMDRARQIALDEGRQYNADYYHEASGTRSKFASGQEAALVRSNNTSFRHLDLLEQQIDNLNNRDVAAVNRLGNAIKTEFGLSSAPTDFDAIKNIAMDEVTKAVIGARGALGDREANQATVDKANSPKLLKSVLRDIYKPAMIDQLQSFKQQYVAGTHGGDQSEKEFGAKLSPEVADALQQKEAADKQARAQSAGAAAGQKPSLQQFLEKARSVNPGVKDDELTKYYHQKYG